VLSRGEVALICQYHLHRDPRFFRQPLAFHPQRFLEDEIPRRVYLPFGAGRRQCLGEKLAWAEGTLLVAACAQSLDLTLLGDLPEPLPFASIQPDRPVTVRAQATTK
jgi:cytochrome P450